MSKWFIINALVFLFALWKITTGYHGIHMVIGGIGLCFILYNWSRHAMFSSIRANIPRKKKIRLATFSKKVLPLHKWTGSIAFLLILVHMRLVFHRFGLHLHNWKMTSGLIALIILMSVVLAGWLRWYKTTVKRRYTHWILGFILFFTIVVHLLL